MGNSKIVKLFSNVNFFIFITTSFLAMLILNFLLINILPENALNIPSELINISRSWLGKVYIILIGPVMETVFFQVIPISTTRAMIHKENLAFIISTLVSALLFSLVHAIYSIYYIPYAFIGGFVLAIVYNLSIYRKENSFLSTFILHALWNLFCLLLLKYDFI